MVVAERAVIVALSLLMLRQERAVWGGVAQVRGWLGDGLAKKGNLTLVLKPRLGIAALCKSIYVFPQLAGLSLWRLLFFGCSSD